MAFVRPHGNQVAIVHGERTPESGSVEQRIIFTLYSKEEAREAIGEGGRDGAHRFRCLLEYRYPQLKFNWDKIAKGIRDNMGVLPDSYQYRDERLKGNFRKGLCAFARQLMLADPQAYPAAFELISDQQHELEYLRDLISLRLKVSTQMAADPSKDNRFCWRYELQGLGVPVGIEEYAQSIYEGESRERSQAFFLLLVECFDDYADGFNCLGAIALEQGKVDEAIEQFNLAVNAGRKLFPKRVRKDSYWSNTDTRPYMRGLRNLALALNQAGQCDKALKVCSRMDQECGDTMIADSRRAAIYLNMGDWKAAAECALRVRETFASDSLVLGFALYELGSPLEALESFLHGALNRPRAARMLTGGDSPAPGSFEESEDHNEGVELLRQLDPYFEKRSPESARFFKRIVSAEPVVALMNAKEDAVLRWERARSAAGKRADFELFHRMRTLDYARERAQELAPLVLPGRSRGTRDSRGKAQ
jgi:tetratricopeptide (TPR) repeat protein